MKKLLSLILLLTVITATAQEKKQISIEKIFSGEFSPEGIFGLNPMKNGEYYSALENGSKGNQVIAQYSYSSGKKIKDLVNTADISAKLEGKSINIDDYAFSADEKKLLILTETEHIYRHSSRSTCYVWSLETKDLVKVAEGKLMYPSFNSGADKIAYVRDNNLFVFDLATGAETAISMDGRKNAIIYGATDWVYEEEFALSQGYQWSPDGKKIAYYRFDESQVKEFSMDNFGKLYPEQDRFKYPKAGESNSIVDVYIYNLENSGKVKADRGTNDDIYLPRIHWSGDNKTLYIQKLNRLQNELEILAVKPDGNTSVIHKESSKYYIDIADLYAVSGNRFILQSERSGFNHIYLYDANGKLIKQLSEGQYDVETLHGVNEKKGLVYFSTSMGNAIDQKLYSVSLKGGKPTEITKSKGVNSVSFNSDFTYFINSYSTISQVPVISLHKADGSQVRVLKDNQNLSNKLKEYKMGEASFFTFNSAGNNLNGWMIKPADFDPNRKYPVLMYVYGGPGRNTVMNSWGYSNYMWFQMLAQKGYIIVSVDNRGTGSRGEAFRKATYLQLGKLETEDQMAAASWLGQQGYVDKSRIGIFGWSYGGYMSSLCISKGADLFKTAIAVAPVTNWRYYDNIYTERFMRTPQENGKNYDENSPISHVEKIKGNFLIIHGMADDNVHFQNTVEMVDRMIKAGVKYDSEIYPNKNHGIGGKSTRIHLYNRMTDFILEKL